MFLVIYIMNGGIDMIFEKRKLLAGMTAAAMAASMLAAVPVSAEATDQKVVSVSYNFTASGDAVFVNQYIGWDGVTKEIAEGTADYDFSPAGAKDGFTNLGYVSYWNSDTKTQDTEDDVTVKVNTITVNGYVFDGVEAAHADSEGVLTTDANGLINQWFGEAGHDIVSQDGEATLKFSADGITLVAAEQFAPEKPEESSSESPSDIDSSEIDGGDRDDTDPEVSKGVTVVAADGTESNYDIDVGNSVDILGNILSDEELLQVTSVKWTFTVDEKEAAAAVSGDKWVSGGVGFNSTVTGWEGHEWSFLDGVKDLTMTKVSDGVYELSYTSDEPIYAGEETNEYAQIWFQNWPVTEGEGDDAVDVNYAPSLKLVGIEITLTDTSEDPKEEESSKPEDSTPDSETDSKLEDSTSDDSSKPDDSQTDKATKNEGSATVVGNNSWWGSTPISLEDLLGDIAVEDLDYIVFTTDSPNQTIIAGNTNEVTGKNPDDGSDSYWKNFEMKDGKLTLKASDINFNDGYYNLNAVANNTDTTPYQVKWTAYAKDSENEEPDSQPDSSSSKPDTSSSKPDSSSSKADEPTSSAAESSDSKADSTAESSDSQADSTANSNTDSQDDSTPDQPAEPGSDTEVSEPDASDADSVSDSTAEPADDSTNTDPQTDPDSQADSEAPADDSSAPDNIDKVDLTPKVETVDVKGGAGDKAEDLDGVTLKVTDASGETKEYEVKDGKADFTGLPEGKYTVVAEKDGYAPRTYENSNLKDLSIELHKWGDIDGDNEITVKDSVRVTAHAKKIKALEGYDAVVGDIDQNSDINVKDSVRVTAAAKKIRAI